MSDIENIKSVLDGMASELMKLKNHISEFESSLNNATSGFLSGCMNLDSRIKELEKRLDRIELLSQDLMKNFPITNKCFKCLGSGFIQQIKEVSIGCLALDITQCIVCKGTGTVYA